MPTIKVLSAGALEILAERLHHRLHGAGAQDFDFGHFLSPAMYAEFAQASLRKTSVIARILCGPGQAVALFPLPRKRAEGARDARVLTDPRTSTPRSIEAC